MIVLSFFDDASRLSSIDLTARWRTWVRQSIRLVSESHSFSSLLIKKLNTFIIVILFLTLSAVIVSIFSSISYSWISLSIWLTRLNLLWHSETDIKSISTDWYLQSELIKYASTAMNARQLGEVHISKNRHILNEWSQSFRASFLHFS